MNAGVVTVIKIEIVILPVSKADVAGCGGWVGTLWSVPKACSVPVAEMVTIAHVDLSALLQG